MERNQGAAANPYLTDVFRSALESAKGTQAEPPPQPRIEVHGSQNVFSWGGAVHVNFTPRTAHRKAKA